MKINVTGGVLSPQEENLYVAYVHHKHKGRQIKQLDINLDGEFVDLKITFKDTDFQAAYRSTDYLVNSLEKLNDAKRAEFADKQYHWVTENDENESD